MEEGSDDSEEESDGKESLGDDFTGISALCFWIIVKYIQTYI